jgi:hypothetical protein
MSTRREGPAGDAKERYSMTNQAKKTPSMAGVKKKLEEVAGRSIDASDQELALSFVRPIASSTYLSAHEPPNDSWVTKERLIFPKPFCVDSQLLDTAGRSQTGPDGKIVFRLSSFLCGRDSIGAFEEPVNLVATPQGTSPAYITMVHELIPVDPAGDWFSDVQITAFSWGPNGAAAPSVSFYWRCRVVADVIIL